MFEVLFFTKSGKSTSTRGQMFSPRRYDNPRQAALDAFEAQAPRRGETKILVQGGMKTLALEHDPGVSAQQRQAVGFIFG